MYELFFVLRYLLLGLLISIPPFAFGWGFGHWLAGVLYG